MVPDHNDTRPEPMYPMQMRPTKKNQAEIRKLPNRQMVDLREYKDEIMMTYNQATRSTFMPDEKAVRSLYKFWQQANPRKKLCMTCRGERSRLIKYFKSKINEWTNQ